MGKSLLNQKLCPSPSQTSTTTTTTQKTLKNTGKDQNDDLGCPSDLAVVRKNEHKFLILCLKKLSDVDVLYHTGKIKVKVRSKSKHIHGQNGYHNDNNEVVCTADNDYLHPPLAIEEHVDMNNDAEPADIKPSLMKIATEKLPVIVKTRGSYKKRGEVVKSQLKKQKNKIKIKNTCIFCGKPFGSFEWLVRHIRVHTRERPYFCSKCDKTFVQEVSLNYHMRTSHLESGQEVQKLKCQNCPKMFGSLTTLKTHLVVHTGEKHYLCTECPKSFTQSASLYRHKKTHLQPQDRDYKYKCTHLNCFKAYEEKSHLNNHMKSHLKLPQELYTCTICQKKFGMKKNLDSHIKTHVKVKEIEPNEDFNFACHVPDCGCRFEENFLLESHLKKIHGDGRVLKCPESNCGKFFNSIELIAHRENIHSERGWVHKCDFENCGKTFGQKKHLEVHQKRHDTERPFECEKCGKTFKEKRGYIEHLLGYLGIKKYKCDNCTEGIFKTLRELRCHQKIFEKSQMIFECLKCDATFCSENNLSCHKKSTHPKCQWKGPLPFGCSFCSLHFRTKHELRRHEGFYQEKLAKCENDQKPKIYTCSNEECRLTFCTYPSLLTHEKTHKKKK